MRRLLGFKDSKNTPSPNTKGKERQRDFAPAPFPIPLSSRTPMEIHISTEVRSANDRQGFPPLESSTNPTPPSSTSSDPRPLPPEIRVPTHPYPYWQGYAHTPSSSSQSSLGSPMTPSHVSWLNAPGVPDASGSSSNINQNLNNPAPAPQPSSGPPSSHSLSQGRSSPSPSFPPPPPMNPPPNIAPRPKLHSTKSSYSLRVPVQEFFNQQLSPIVEQDYFSPEKRPVSLPSSNYEGSRNSTAHTARTSAIMMTPISPGSEGFGSATVTPVTPIPITPVLISTRGAPPTPQVQAQTPVTPSYPGGVVPFARRKEEELSDSPRPSPVSTFILRPLNRSISLSSTRTHQSSISSATPPVIPPLDLRPEFKGQSFVTTPTSLRPQGLLDVGMRDDDSVSDRRESFITARTGMGRDSRYSVGQEEIFVDAEEGFIRDSEGTVHQFDSRLLDTPPTPQSIPQNTPKPVKPPIPARTPMHFRSASHASSSPPSYQHPSGPQSSDNYLHPHPQPRPHRSTPSPSPQPSRLGTSAPSLNELGYSISTSSSFVDRRFASSSLYLLSKPERESARKAGAKWSLRRERIDTVQVLFWLGFIAPWCWLIGGWAISPKSSSHGHNSGLGYGHGNGYHSGSGSRGAAVLPLWTDRSRSMQSFDTTKMHLGYPFVAPSVLSLTPPPPPYQSQRMPVVCAPKSGAGLRRGEMRNPWVRRCRIAAVTSGVLLAIALIVVFAVAATRRSL